MKKATAVEEEESRQPAARVSRPSLTAPCSSSHASQHLLQYRHSVPVVRQRRLLLAASQRRQARLGRPARQRRHRRVQRAACDRAANASICACCAAKRCTADHVIHLSPAAVEWWKEVPHLCARRGRVALRSSLVRIRRRVVLPRARLLALAWTAVGRRRMQIVRGSSRAGRCGRRPRIGRITAPSPQAARKAHRKRDARSRVEDEGVHTPVPASRGSGRRRQETGRGARAGPDEPETENSGARVKSNNNTDRRVVQPCKNVGVG